MEQQIACFSTGMLLLEHELMSQINNGTYKSGFATTQPAYDRAQRELYSGLDAIEGRLAGKRFLLGDRCRTVQLKKS